MPKVTITFDLPEEFDEMMLALRAGALHGMLCDVDAVARTCLKYGGNPIETLERIREDVGPLLEDGR